MVKRTRHNVMLYYNAYFIIIFHFVRTQSNDWVILISHQETRHQRISTHLTVLGLKLRPQQQASLLRLLIFILSSTQMSVGTLKQTASTS
jgi:hypothetical protein